MNSTERLTSSTIHDLAHSTGPCITIVLPASTSLSSVDDRLRVELWGRGVDSEPLLAPLGEAAKAGGPIAILRSPSVMKIFPVDESIPAVLHVGDRFSIRTLLTIRNAQKDFWLLALSRHRTRLLKCTEAGSEEIALPDAMAAGDPEDRHESMVHLFREIDKAVSKILKDSNEPLVVAGVEQERGLYRTLNTCKHVVEPGVHGSPDGLEGGEMHRRALELLKERDRDGAQVAADFDKRVGTGHASAHVQEIVQAAWEGRVSHFFFRQDASYRGRFDEVRQVVKHAEDPLSHAEDLIDAAAWQTILHGGEAHLLPASALPRGVPVCALFRYPLATAAKPVESEPVAS